MAVVPLANLPIELHWSHLPKGKYPSLGTGEDATVGVFMRAGEVGREYLFITGMHVDYPVGIDMSWERRQLLLVKLEVRGPVGEKLGTWTGVVPDAESSVGYVPLDQVEVNKLVNELSII